MPYIFVLSRRLTRPFSIAVVASWLVVMGALVHRSSSAQTTTLATDLARYGAAAHWRGVYYRGEKLGFTVSQTVPLDAGGFELQEDGQLQMTLLGAHTFTRIRTSARVNRSFELQSFDFSLDPGTGPISVRGEVRGRDLHLTMGSRPSEHTEVRRLEEPPMLTLNLVRRLADAGLEPGTTHRWSVFDPATLRNAPMTIRVIEREVVEARGTPIPAARVEMAFAGLTTVAWVTDTGEIVREESPLGFISVRETPERARALAVSGEMRRDLLEANAVVPQIAPRTPPLPPIDDPRNVVRLRMRVTGIDLTSADLSGSGQSVAGDLIEIVDATRAPASTAAGDEHVEQYLRPEPFIESDDASIRAAAVQAVGKAVGSRARTEALTRWVNSAVQKKPTVSLPSAREVLRTRIGDCNEHTALFVAMARAAGIPARIAVGLAFVRGAFYYHAWPEVYLTEPGRAYWLPVDPTFNQFPADATHLRLARGGLDKQAAILPMIGRIGITLLDVEVVPGTTQVLVGRAEPAPVPVSAPARQPRRWCLPCMDGHK